MTTVAIMFNTHADAAKLAEFLKVAKIDYKEIELMEGTLYDELRANNEKLMGFVRDVYASPKEKLTKELERAEKTFQQNPTPAMASVIKTLKGKIRYQVRKEQK